MERTEEDPVWANERACQRSRNGLGCAALVLLAAGYYLASLTVPEDRYFLRFGGLAIPGLLIFLSARSLRYWRGHEIVLWFRPYQMDRDRARWIAALLTSALRGRGIGIALDDRKHTVGDYGFPDPDKRCTVIALLFLAILGLAYGVGGDPAYRHALLIGLGPRGALVVLVATALMALILPVNKRWRFHQKRVVTGSPSEIHQTVQRLIARIASPLAYCEPLILLGVEGTDKHDLAWQAVVDELVGRSELAIFTLSRFDPDCDKTSGRGFAWEVRTWIDRKRCNRSARTIFLLADPPPLASATGSRAQEFAETIVLGRRGNHLFLSMPWGSQSGPEGQQMLRGGTWGQHLRFALFGDLEALSDGEAFLTTVCVARGKRRETERWIVRLPEGWPWSTHSAVD